MRNILNGDRVSSERSAILPQRNVTPVRWAPWVDIPDSHISCRTRRSTMTSVTSSSLSLSPDISSLMSRVLNDWMAESLCWRAAVVFVLLVSSPEAFRW